MGSSQNTGNSSDQHAHLLRIAKKPGTPWRVSQRIRMVVGHARGLSFVRIGEALGVTPRTVSRWCQRFRESGIEGLRDASRSGRPKTITDAADRVAELVKVPPPDGERWTVRRVAQLIGISASAVGRIWQALGIHRTNRGASTPVVAACGGSAVPRMRRVKAKIPRYEVCECNRPACANCCLRRFFGIADTVTRAWQGLLDRDEDLQGGVLLITLTCRASADMTGARGLQRARRHWRALKARWRSRWGTMPEHLQSLQWTETGIPHRHVIIPYRGAWHRRQLRDWLVSVWIDIIGEVPTERGRRQYFVHIAYRRSARRTIRYVLDDVWHPMDAVAPRGVGRYRRWATSRGWTMARAEAIGRAGG